MALQISNELLNLEVLKEMTNLFCELLVIPFELFIKLHTHINRLNKFLLLKSGNMFFQVRILNLL